MYLSFLGVLLFLPLIIQRGVSGLNVGGLIPSGVAAVVCSIVLSPPVYILNPNLRGVISANNIIKLMNHSKTSPIHGCFFLN